MSEAAGGRLESCCQCCCDHAAWDSMGCNAGAVSLLRSACGWTAHEFHALPPTPPSPCRLCARACCPLFRCVRSTCTLSSPTALLLRFFAVAVFVWRPAVPGACCVRSWGSIDAVPLMPSWCRLRAFSACARVGQRVQWRAPVCGSVSDRAERAAPSGKGSGFYRSCFLLQNAHLTLGRFRTGAPEQWPPRPPP